MKANELRIGNYVYDRGNKILKIDYWERKDMIAQKVVVGGFVGHPFTEDVEFLKPIPLTEEWLLKFGFEDIRELDNIDFKEYRMINEYSFCVQFPCGVEAHCYAGNYPIAIKYLHQLQNLYFALTGKELTMK